MILTRFLEHAKPRELEQHSTELDVQAKRKRSEAHRFGVLVEVTGNQDVVQARSMKQPFQFFHRHGLG